MRYVCPRLFSAVSLLLAFGSMAATRTVILQDYLGTDWRDELVHESLTFAPGELMHAVANVSHQSLPVPAQVSDVVRHVDGSVASMKVWFKASVDADGRAEYAIDAGVASSVTTSLRMTRADGSLTLTTEAPQRLGWQFLDGEKAFDWPLAMAAELAPLQRLLLPSGKAVGQPRIAVPFRLSSYRSRIVASGPLFVDVEITYLFECGYWTYRARVIDGCPMLQVNEEFNTGHSGQSASAADRFFTLQLNTDGFAPSQGWYTDNAGSPKYTDLGKRLIPESWEATGVLPRDSWIAAPVSGYTLSFASDRDDFYLQGWPSVMAGIGSFIRFVEPGGDAVGFGNLEIMGWRDAMVIRFRSHANGDLTVNFPLQKYTQDWPIDGFADGSPNYTGITLGVPPNTGRRSYGIMLSTAEDESEQRLSSLSAMAAHLAAQPLDEVKDWVLDWPDPLADQTWAETPSEAASKALTLMQGRTKLARIGGNLTNFSMGNHYYYSGSVYTAVAPIINDPKQVTAAQRRRLRRLCAFEAYRQNSAELFPYGSGVHLNNPNMTVMAVKARVQSALVVRDHPQFPVWGRETLNLLRAFIDRFTKESGAPYENPHYTLGVTFDGAAEVNNILIDAGIGDAFDTELFGRTMHFVLNWLTPPDPRFLGYRMVLPIGNGSYQSVPPEFGQRIVTYYRERDPKLAGELQWLTNQTLPEDQRLAIVEDRVPELGSAWYKDYGVFFRHGFGTEYETLMHLLAGTCFGHGEIESDQMAYTLYAKGQPIHLDFGNGYFPIYNRPWLRNRVSFDMKFEAPEQNRIEVEHASFSPETEYFHAVRETDQLLPRGSEYPILDAAGKWTPEESAAWANTMAVWHDPQYAVPLIIWHRQMMFLKDADPRGPNYFVLRDSFDGVPTVATDLNLWFLANSMAEADGVYHFDGQCKVDMDVYVNTPTPGSFTAHTDRFGHNQQPYRRLVGWDPAYHPGGKLREEQMLLRVHQPPGQGYLVVLYPRLKENDPAAQYERLTDSVVRVTTPLSTDLVLLAYTLTEYNDEQVSLKGRAGAVRWYKSGKIAVVNNEGPCTVTVAGQTISGTAAYVVELADGKAVVTYSADASPVTIAAAAAP